MGKENLFFGNHNEQSNKDSLQNESVPLAQKKIEELKKWGDPKSADFWVKVESALALSSLFLSSCAPVNKEKNPDVALNTPTPNRLVLTETPTKPPLPTETPTELPTPTEEKVEFVPSEPAYREVVEGEYMGVKIKMAIETDKSLDPTIKEMKVNPNFTNHGKKPEDLLMEFSSRVFYGVWKDTRDICDQNLLKDDTFESFMDLWSRAQKSGDISLWNCMSLRIKIDDPIKEGVGLQEQVVWPMFSGVTPSGVIGIESFVSRFVNGNRPQKVGLKQIDEQGFAHTQFMAGNDLYLFVGLTNKYLFGVSSVAVRMWTFAPKMFRDRPINMDRVDRNLELLLNSKDNYASVLQTFPQNDMEKRFNP